MWQNTKNADNLAASGDHDEDVMESFLDETDFAKKAQLLACLNKRAKVGISGQ